ncbi:UDP-N-acetylglucosamine pyrophosphorylase [Kwoniella heveanensis CBS 569]|nr:UDP-N-acetylglucosamine pyrophosphorylase [Kwoniella heveanensis CBS 569]
MSTQINGHLSSSTSTAAGGPDPSLIAKVRETYTNAEQGHVFTFFDKLSPTEQSALIAQLADIDVDRVNRIYTNAVAADGSGSQTPPEAADVEEHNADGLLGNDLSLAPGRPNMIGRSRTPSPRPPEEALPLPEEACATVVNNPTEEKKWRDIGLKAIANNEVAVLLMAGGQGTRLGSSQPKGMYDIKLPSGKSLFEYQAERIGKLARVAEEEQGKEKGSVRIRWYVMTSGPTRGETEKYFKEKGYFGLNPDDVIFFEQGVLPALSEDGKLLLSTPSSLSVAPDGNGGLYAALRRPLSADSPRTVLSDLRDQGVQYVHAYCVDNCLVKVADPVFIGCCVSRQASIGAKVVRKTVPTESVGVLAARGDAFAVVEYSELSKEKAEARTPDGQLAFRAANIANHFYTTSFLEGVEAMERRMAFHIARKKIPTVDLSSGEPIKPTEPNGMKLELFVFDVFPFTKSLCVLEVDRAEEFSPLKNAPGSKADCPETSRRDLLAQQRRWLESAGATIKEGVEVEVTPGVSYAGEGLEWVKGRTIAKSGVVAKKEDLEALVQ